MRVRAFAGKMILPLLIFGLALLVRLPRLDALITPDEEAWAGRSQDFLLGLLNPDYICGGLPEHTGFQWLTGLECTLRTGHPGVTTMWAGSLGMLGSYIEAGRPGPLFHYVENLPTAPLDLGLIPWLRLPSVILVGLLIVAIYGLTLRLFDNGAVAGLAGFLLVFDPFYIAHARTLHHDALESSWAVVALLAALIYGTRQAWWGWLVLSGMAAGLAFLSKSPALFLLPFVVLVLAASFWGFWGSARKGGLIGPILIWLGGAGLTILLFWPALWVMPLAALRTVFSIGRQYVGEGHAHYFLGEVSRDPGPLFYPLIWLLRSSGLVWLGVIGAGAAILTDRQKDIAAARRHQILLLFGYAIAFVFFMSLGAKKQDRYILSVYIISDIIGAVGIIYLVTRDWPVYMKRFHPRLLLAGVVFLLLAYQVNLVLLHFPYYFTYYNPLLGGPQKARQLVTMGWGEGMDRAAAYLNQKEGAEQLKVMVAGPQQSLWPYLRGQKFSPQNPPERMSHDYMVIYLNARQRQAEKPLLAYNFEHLQPEYIIYLHRVAYVWIYANPVSYPFIRPTSQVDDRLILYGYRPLDDSTIRLVWQNQGLPVRQGLWTGLRSQADSPIEWQPCHPAEGFSAQERQQIGRFIESDCLLKTRSLEPDLYTLHIGVGTAKSPDEIAELVGPSGEPAVLIPQPGRVQFLTRQEALDRVVARELPPGASPLHISYGDIIALRGYQITRPETATMRLDLYWQVLNEATLATMPPDLFRLELSLLSVDGDEVVHTAAEFVAAPSSDTGLQTSPYFTRSVVLSLSPEIDPGDYQLTMSLVKTDVEEPVPYQDRLSGRTQTEAIIFTVP